MTNYPFTYHICSLSSLKNLITFNNRNLIKYKSYTSYFTLVTSIGGIFYKIIIIIIYSFVAKVDVELIYFILFVLLFVYFSLSFYYYYIFYY